MNGNLNTGKERLAEDCNPEISSLLCFELLAGQSPTMTSWIDRDNLADIKYILSDPVNKIFATLIEIQSKLSIMY